MLKLKSGHITYVMEKLDRLVLQYIFRRNIHIIPQKSQIDFLRFHYAFQSFTHSNTCIGVRLLGPCFKTGHWGSFSLSNKKLVCVIGESDEYQWYVYTSIFAHSRSNIHTLVVELTLSNVLHFIEPISSYIHLQSKLQNMLPCSTTL